MSISPSKYYQYGENDNVVKCGKCWLEDIRKTELGEYTGIEVVYSENLVLVDQNEPWQCDSCLVQNDAYEELGEDDF